MNGKTLLYDCFSGIAGDMHIGALVDLGVPVEYLQERLAQLSLAEEFTLRISTEKKMGIRGTRARVEIHRGAVANVRHLSDIVNIVESAAYPQAITKAALAIFGIIADAEAQVHGTTPDKIHFHEVGATDSIVDIVAASICLDYLAVDTVLCRTVELGAGMVKCEHGLMPVPAPATAEILRGVPCTYGGVQGEATTPTGAAILKYAVRSFAASGDFKASKVGYGLGRKNFERPNVLRVMLGESKSADDVFKMHNPESDYIVEQTVQIECNVDDMSPEAFQPLMQGLFALGAMDVCFVPLVMKKSRPGQTISILCSYALQSRLVDYLFENSTTLGIRVFNVEKFSLARELRTINTSFGAVQVKIVQLKSGLRRWKTEFEHVQALAQENCLDYLTIKKLIDTEVAKSLSQDVVT